MLWEKARVGWFERIALKHVYYHMWNRSQSMFDAWDRVLRAVALGWPWGMGWGGRWEGQDGEHMYTHSWLMWMYGKNHHNIIKQKQWHPTPVLLPGKSMDRGAWKAAVHGVSRSRTQLSDFTVFFHFHALEKEMATFQCSCLENSWDRGAWWAPAYGVAQSRTWLKRLSSSSSIACSLPKI